MGRRCNYDRLPWPVRCRILSLLCADTPFEEIRADPDVAAALDNARLSLRDPAFRTILESEEYSAYRANFLRDAATRTADRMAAAVLAESDALRDVADAARYELAKQIRDLLSELDTFSEPAERIKAAHTLAQSLSSLANPVGERKISLKNAEIAALRKALAEKELLIGKMREKLDANENLAVLNEMNKSVGLT